LRSSALIVALACVGFARVGVTNVASASAKPAISAGITDLGALARIYQYGGTLADAFIPGSVNEEGVIGGEFVETGPAAGGYTYRTEWPAYWRAGKVALTIPFDSPGNPSKSKYCGTTGNLIDDNDVQFGQICVRNTSVTPAWYSPNGRKHPRRPIDPLLCRLRVQLRESERHRYRELPVLVRVSPGRVQAFVHREPARIYSCRRALLRLCLRRQRRRPVSRTGDWRLQSFQRQSTSAIT
jgi:hypothetical protein